MRSQDIITALVLVLADETPTYVEIGEKAGLSTSEAHASVRRLRDARIVDGDRGVVKRTLLDFLVHGAPFAFPGTPKGMSLGVPTGGLGPGLDAAPAPERAMVWPDEHGTVRGLALEPLHPSVPQVVGGNPRLHGLLAAVDLLRCSPTARERAAATALIERALSTGIAAKIWDSATPPDVRGADALEQVFAEHKVVGTIRRAVGDGPSADDVVVHPFERVLLIAYRSEIAHHVSIMARNQKLQPGPAYALADEKPDGSERTFVYPQLVDRIAMLRLVEALEPPVRAGDEGRVFLPRRHSSGPFEDPVYADTGGQWKAFVESVRAASIGDGMVCVLRADVQEFFASIRPEVAREAVARVTGAHPIAIALLFRLLDGWSPATGYRPADGLPIEPTDASRLVAHCILKAVDDQFEDDFELRYRRFMDDVVILADSAETATRARARHQRALMALGLRHNAKKTERYPVDDYLQGVLALGVHTELEAVTDAAGLERWLETWDAPGEILPPTTGVHKRLYGIARKFGSPRLAHRLRADLSVPGLLQAVLSYTCREPLSPSSAEVLFERFEQDSTPGVDRVRLASALADSRFANGESEAFVDRAMGWIRDRTGPCAARAHLAYSVYKHAPERAGDLVGLGMDSMSEPFLGLALLVIGRAAESPLSTAAQVALAATGRSDVYLTMRLVDDLTNGSPACTSALLESCGIGSTVRASHLPLLHVASRGANPKGREALVEGLRERLDGPRRTADDPVRGHLQACLERAADV